MKFLKNRGNPQAFEPAQRIALRFHLSPFDPDELDHYVDERLRLAGYTGKGIFGRSARRALHAYTGGVPRLVNVICDSALLTGYSRGLHTLGVDVIEEVARDLHLSREVLEKAAEGPVGSKQKPRRVPAPRKRRRRGWFGRRR